MDRSNTTYLTAGTPNARPIILIHGAGVSRTLWHRQLDLLAQHFYVLAPDLPGHGALVDIPFTLKGSVQTIADLIEKENLQAPLLAGISLGGYVAIAHAKRYPHQSSGLILSGSSMNLNGMNGIGYLGVSLMIKWKGSKTIEEGSRKTMERLIPEDSLAGLLEGGLYYQNADRAFSQLAMKNYTKMLKNYPSPILLLNGAEDEPNCKGAEKMVAALPNVEVKVIEDAGHLVNLEQPDAFTAAMISFALNGAKTAA